MNNITLEEHEIIGMIGKKLNDKLVTREVEITNNAKSKLRGRKLSKHWREANEHLSKFRDHMEEIMFIENPELKKLSKVETSNIYYGGSDREGDIIKWIKKYLKTEKELNKIKQNEGVTPSKINK